MFVEGGLWELWLSAWTWLGAGIPRDSVAPPFPWALAFGCGLFGPRVLAGVAVDSPRALADVAQAVRDGLIRPVVGERFSYTSVVQAHRFVDARHRRGAVILDFDPPQTLERGHVRPRHRVPTVPLSPSSGSHRPTSREARRVRAGSCR
ncbi:MAG: zinc-binding dehydrogenase [Myxococcales bacterium]|nr:zinc-binding dehydrogenase [Myxococcales bacterium]